MPAPLDLENMTYPPGKFTTKQYAELHNIAQDAARNRLDKAVRLGILVKKVYRTRPDTTRSHPAWKLDRNRRHVYYQKVPSPR